MKSNIMPPEDSPMQLMTALATLGALGMEYKAVKTSYKALDDTGWVEGLYSVFGNLDEGNDIVHQGAFLKTLDERAGKIRVFYIHDWAKPIGPSPQIIKENSVGLYAKHRLTLDSFWGHEAFVLIKDEALPEGSFGYSPVRWEFEEDDEGKQIRHLHELKLFEISPVPLGMNPLTSVEAAKAAYAKFLRSDILPHSGDPAEKDAVWDGGAVLKKVKGAKDLRAIHAYVDPLGDPASPSSYKFAHHDADGKVVLNGLLNATARLTSAELSPEDMGAVKRHLAHHFSQFEQVPTWEREADWELFSANVIALGESLTALPADLSPEKRLEILGVLTAIETVRHELEQAVKEKETPTQAGKELSARVLTRRLRLAGANLRGM